MVANHSDVLIIGAGISGISAAWHLQKLCPQKSYTILERRARIGGTWDLFKYPGIRSDSDMYTLGYRFKPWTDEKAIASADSILHYLNETADENNIRQHMRFNRHVKEAHWSSDRALWTVDVIREDTGETEKFTCKFLFSCAGYYNYDTGYTPEFEGRDDYRGQIIHPQHWPEDLDYNDKRVIVIGSGATAVTLVPELAKDASHVTMLQRTPTYMASKPSIDAAARFMMKFLPDKFVYDLIRWRNVLLQMYIYRTSKKKPEKVKEYLLDLLKDELPEDYDIEKHFSPDYNPWDQRVCLVTDGDLFSGITDGSINIVTDHIETFTEKGLKLKSGEELEADIIITSTGLDLHNFGGARVFVDGREIASGECMTYKGMMYSDVPNMAVTFGYTNASWTLKADLTSEFVCRILNHMDEIGTVQCMSHLSDPEVEEEPIVDFSSGYFLRAQHRMPKQGSKKPWKLNQNYALDIMSLRFGRVEDGVLTFKTADELKAIETEPAMAAE